MIYTITFNPAVDLVIQVPNCELGGLNRSTREHYVAGGKGINMSIVLQRLGHDNCATGFLGGFSGKFIEEALLAEKVTPNFIDIEGITRINVKLKSDVETEINAAGPTISPEQFEELVAYLEARLVSEDVVFLAGNAAPGLDETAYTRIAALCQQKQAKLVLDTNKALLSACLPYQPFIIKPNHHELGELFDVEIDDEATIIHYATELQKRGARNVLVSRGGKGAVLVTETGECYRSNVPKGTLVNSVGAGDSMLAGFMAKYLETTDYAKSLQQGAATGSATAFSVGIAEKSLIMSLVDQVSVEKIN
ncbi:MAG: 1-phosphofructokinase [Aerococcaceae bacterium]|nr:1-phosphofructokinase [Aerococcaceae bacterium]